MSNGQQFYVDIFVWFWTQWKFIQQTMELLYM